jgi:exonuclease VII large subunit
MARGYSITSKINPKTGKKTVVRKSGQLQRDDQVEILLHEGSAECRVLTTKNI